MKRSSYLFLIVAAIASLSLYSCNYLDDEGDYYYDDLYPNAMVTVKTAPDGRMYLQLDEQTTLLPTNMTTSPFGKKEVRALTNIRRLTEKPSGDYDEAVSINWIDSILTKTTVPFIAGENDDSYGIVPLEIVDDWVTVVEDGYLTLHLRMNWQDPDAKHHINLLTGGNPDDPYEVELRHGVDRYNGGVAMVADTYVAFRLNELPDTEGKTVKLTLKWISSRGDRSAEFDYRSREYDKIIPTTEE